MTQASRDGARRFIDGVRMENGGLTKEDTEFLQRNKPHILTAYNNQRRKLGASTKTLATNLYAKDSRFVYELIQNAEDNRYYRAREDLDEPWLRFCLDQDQIVIDSNEDGFSEANIKAICSIGESTKTCKQGYVGEKGIGFKSVFKVAQKVHVQSGPFSFAFEYRREDRDDGLGMITPMYEERLSLPKRVRTRMILHLLDNCDREALRNELINLPDTLLLFLKKLKEISVQIKLAEHPEHSLWMKNTVPVLEEQHVYAFLPLRKVGYKFLIQSDFITQASREDVFDSQWNCHLLNRSCDTFMDSIDEFLRHPTLKYHWVSYIPTDHIADDFWGRLQQRILASLGTRNLFVSESNGNSWNANQLRVVPERFRGEDTQPLLLDVRGGSSAYISESYDKQLDLPILRKLGTKDLDITEFLQRLEKDLDQNGTESRMRSTPLQSSWHTKVARLLTFAARKFRLSVKKLPVVPLSTGKWARPLNASIYFPTSGGIEIPDDLPLAIVDAKALQNKSWERFFVEIGITHCPPSRVFPLIEQRYSLFGRTFKESLSHIKFMFWNHTELPPQGVSLRLKERDDSVWFSNAIDNVWTYSPRLVGSYTTSTVLGSPVPLELREAIRVLDPAYYRALRKLGHRNDRTGPEWLDSFLQIKDTIQLSRRNSIGEMSTELKYVAKKKPEFILGVLETAWSHYQTIDTWDNFFKAVEVPILNSQHTRNLASTFLPLPKLCAVVGRLGLDADFGFLKELEGLTDISASKWEFLKQFGVGVEGDVSFWLKLLEQARAKVHVESHVVFEIYTNLQKFDSSWEVEKIQAAFRDDVIFLPPAQVEESARWISLTSCLWEAPEWFNLKFCLGTIKGYDHLSNLFKITLGARTAGCADFLEYLRDIKDNRAYLTSADEQAKIPKIYKMLGKEAVDKIESHRIRLQFEENSLVFDPNKKCWHCPSSCVWADARIQLPGKLSLASTYEGHLNFFTRVLRIPKSSLAMHIVALTQKVLEQADKTTALQEMLNICALNPTSEALESLRNCECLPIKTQSGATEWHDCSTDFAIVDRREYGAMFEGKVRILDFSLEEVHSLQRFLFALGLGTRYISRLVEEKTYVQDNELDPQLTCDMRKKAYAIYRYAAHLGINTGGEEGSSVYQTLQQISVYFSDDISKTVSIVQDRKAVTIERETAYFHLVSENGQLNLFVPRCKGRQQICLERHLPTRLLKHLGAQNISGSEGLSSIIIASSLSVVDEFLQLDGIIEVDGIVRPIEDEGYNSDSSAGNTNLTDSQSTPGYPTTPTLQPSTTHHTRSENSCPSDPSPGELLSLGSPIPSELPDLYRKLLDAVIRQARDISDLPKAGGVVTSHLSADSGLNARLALRSPYDGEEKFKIGAAGELFVFELLQSLSLPGFNLDNWQSGIRGRISVHPSYHGIVRWPDKEITDIIYEDRNSALTTLLIEKGYLTRSKWEGRSPKFCIEVKTTPYEMSYPFFCSQPQCDMMENMQLSAESDLGEIYLVARVFGLGGSGMGLKLYVDPASLRNERELVFQADKYAVTPATRVDA
ncbi:uncharacterized protein BDR25DRAFT_380700 [Lindgomyces ingoldianus]|uniref:Uncharacterized protein n=1 Tax=Lindgomyces ingoldianus TaxID=673940 RepID=A0ACB6QCT9_9PLEO|nr:uncharacterized protein BDR25DRAFT_380700 [Lindgomyces ingoldianus]KAF2464794.1 hypothetical protein BDR25DRAFT_380700 [Lindgomyces ingoldianus]